jgi:hypothetical protein
LERHFKALGLVRTWFNQPLNLVVVMRFEFGLVNLDQQIKYEACRWSFLKIIYMLWSCVDPIVHCHNEKIIVLWTQWCKNLVAKILVATQFCIWIRSPQESNGHKFGLSHILITIILMANFQSPCF